MNFPAVDEQTRELIRMAVREDVGTGDRTVEVAIPAELRGAGFVVARKAGVICGTQLIEPILAEYAGEARCEVLVSEGQVVEAGPRVARLSGQVRKILSAG